MAKEDYEGMEFNPFAPFGDTPMVEHYPRLEKVKAFSFIPEEYEELGWDKFNLSTFLKFIIVFIDDQSPLFEERNFEKRKAEARKIVGIKQDSLEYEELHSEGMMFRELIYEYFRLIHSIEYEQWFSYTMQIHAFNKYLRRPLTSNPDKLSADVNSRNNLMKQIDTFTEKLQSLEAVIFNDDRLIKIINEKAVQNSIGGYAERFASLPEWH
jgi:hypothetical protein